MQTSLTEQPNKNVLVNFWSHLNFFKKNSLLNNDFSYTHTTQTNFNIFFKPIFPRKVLIWAGNVVKSMFFNFEFVQFERFVTYLFKITPLQKVNKVVLFIKQLILIKSLNPNLISISIILKGKFGGYGNARKKKIKITTGPVYYYNHPRFGLVVQPTEVSHYFFLYTTTGVTSVICYLKHNH